MLPRYTVAVFVDGCFWHGCSSHGTRHFRGPNASRWEAKITTNMERDARTPKLRVTLGGPWCVSGSARSRPTLTGLLSASPAPLAPVLRGACQPVVTATSKVASTPSSSCGRVGQ
ncbi:hypothetical protein [Streptomyces sp. NPDC006270]|uniref:hypothetical protein n=1 Tax=Streptomyces sp. NPDC006270 TaxID=3364741 RepID=UPI0036AA9895